MDSSCFLSHNNDSTTTATATAGMTGTATTNNNNNNNNNNSTILMMTVGTLHQHTRAVFSNLIAAAATTAKSRGSNSPGSVLCASIV
jgi:hypothetical protein